MGRIRQGSQQPFRIGMGGMIKNILYPSRFHDDTGIHDINAPAHLGDDAEVVGNEDDSHLVLLLQGSQELQYLGFGRHVESRRRFVGKEEARLTGKSHGDETALAHPA